MKEISLISKKYPGKTTMVDDSDYEYLNKFKWFVFIKEHTFYATRSLSRKLNGGKQKTIFMHREILSLLESKKQSDHIDHNGLNNQRSNLRVVTPSQNCINRTSHKNSTSKYKGVHLVKIIGRKNGQEKVYCYWRAIIGINNKVFGIGNFKTESEAALAYNKKAIELHGEFANLNKIA